MSTELQQYPLEQPDERGLIPVASIRAQMVAIREAMKDLMKQDVHYGIIPGTKKPTLLKEGSELLLTMFRIGVDPEVVDLSGEDIIRYQVRARGFHIPTGRTIGYGIGECSSDEEKYRWRRAVCNEEWEDTDPERRRVKWFKGDRKPYSVKQVRTNPADVANTVLKMGKKRAQVDLTLTATAASDMFGQDMEDLPEGMRGESEGRAEVKSPQTKSGNANGGQQKAGEQQSTSGPITESALKVVRGSLKNRQVTEQEVCKEFDVKKLEDVPMSKVNDVLEFLAQFEAAD